MRKSCLLIVVIWVLFLSCPPAGSAASERRGKALFQAARDLWAKAKTNQDREHAIKKYEQALEIFTKTRSDKWRGMTLSNIGFAYHRLGEYEKALGYYEQALSVHRKSGNVQAEGTTLGNIASVLLKSAQPQKALEYRKKELTIKRAAGDTKGEAVALAFIGHAYQRLDQHQKAAEYYEKALEAYQKTGDLKKQGTTLSTIGYLYGRIGRHREALDYYDKALAMHKKADNPAGEGITLNNMSLSYRELSEYDKARACGEKSLELAREIGNRDIEATALKRIGEGYRTMGHYRRAIECYAQALTLPGKSNNYYVGDILNNMGLAYNSMGEYQKAFECLEKALENQRELGVLREEGNTQNNIGGVYFNLGQYREALKCYEKGLDINRKTGHVRAEAGSLSNIGRFYHSWGDRQKALEYYRKAGDIYRKIGFLTGEANSWSHIGSVCFGLNKYDEALQHYQKALALVDRIGSPSGWIKTSIAAIYVEKGELDKAEAPLKDLSFGDQDESGDPTRNWAFGKLYLKKTDFSRAKTCYETLLGQGEKRGDLRLLVTAYTGLGKVHEGLEDCVRAEEYYDKAMKLTEEIRSELLPSERKNFFDVWSHGFRRSEPANGLTRVRMKLNKGGTSIDSSEVTRARAFSDLLAQRTESGYADVPKAILVQEDALDTKVAVLKKELSRTKKESEPGRYQLLSAQVRDAEADLNAFVEMLWNKFTTYASVKYPRPVTLKESRLKLEEYVVIFDVSQEGVGIKLIKGKEIAETYYKKWDLEALERAVNRFRQPFEELKLRDFDPELGKSLYVRLLSRVLAEVPQGTPLIIIPDKILAVLPFEALVVSGKANWKGDGPRAYPEGITYLGDVHPISYYQSITALTQVRSLRSADKRRGKTLILSDPVFDTTDPRAHAASRVAQQKLLHTLPEKLMSIKNQTGLSFPRLPLTAKLGEALKRIHPEETDVFMGMEATKSLLNSLQVSKKLADYGTIIFATHGYFGKDLPGIQEPVLALTLADQTEDQDGFLRMTEVMSMKFDADVVALTACQTGLGNSVSGEGVMSMGRAFQVAGARSVLMSLWSVSENASVLLVEKFFAHLNAGKAKLAALTAARQDVRNAGYQHPFYWAPFILVGETD